MRPAIALSNLPETFVADPPPRAAPPGSLLVADAEPRRIVSPAHTLLQYPCGVSAGERLRLRRVLHLETELGRPIGQTIGTASAWVVLAGDPQNPEVVWFEDPRGELHAWDAASLWQDFEAMDVE